MISPFPRATAPTAPFRSRRAWEKIPKLILLHIQMIVHNRRR
jgi:hypothetical protein